MTLREAIKAIEDGLHTSLAIDGACAKKAKEAVEWLKEQPERDKGHWIVKWDDEVKTTYGECSRCGCVQYAGVTNFCHECGADMREVKNEE